MHMAALQDNFTNYFDSISHCSSSLVIASTHFLSINPFNYVASTPVAFDLTQLW
jgi:hypothetical protein